MKLKSAQLTDPKPNQRECHGSVSRMGPATSSFGRRDVSVNSNRAEFGNLRVSNWIKLDSNWTQHDSTILKGVLYKMERA